MYSIASTATDLETGINMLHNGTIDVLRFIDDAHAAENIDEVIIDPLVNVLVPVIKYLEETPTRAIVIAAVVRALGSHMHIRMSDHSTYRACGLS